MLVPSYAKLMHKIIKLGLFEYFLANSSKKMFLLLGVNAGALYSIFHNIYLYYLVIVFTPLLCDKHK